MAKQRQLVEYDHRTYICINDDVFQYRETITFISEHIMFRGLGG